MLSILPSVLILGLVAVAALALALRRTSPAAAAQERLGASRVLGFATAIQAGHFMEEWLTGFHVRFPALLGLDPMPLSFFVPFNLAWIVVWVVSVPFLRHGQSFAFFAAWFLTIAAVLNAVAHPLMAIASGGYFPGLVTSPFIGLAGVLLLKRLHKATTGSTNSR